MSENAVPKGNFEFREKMKAVAEQLRQPKGEFGLKVAENMNVSNKEMYELLFNQIEIPNNAQVLEIGFGSGFFFPQYLKINPSAHLFGIDFSEDMCILAKDKNATLLSQKTLEITVADVQKLPFNDNSFEVITSLNTIYFWENPVSCFKELKRVLKANGKIYICFRPMHVMKNYEFTQHGFSFFELEDVVKNAQLAGLKYYKHDSISYPKKSVTGQDVNSVDISLILSK